MPEDNYNQLQPLRDQVTIVIPTLNEAAALGKLLEEIDTCGYHNVLVVDGHSSDRTCEIALRDGALLLEQYGKGKAGAILTAIENMKTPYFILMDGDYSYDPLDLDKFLPAIVKGYDYIASFRPKKSPNINSLHRLGNYIITKAFNLLMGSHLPDVCSGMYALKTEKTKLIQFEKHPMTVEEEIAAQMVVEGKYTSVPISYRRRLGTSKTQTWRQGFRDLYAAIDLGRRYNPIALFSVLASVAIIPGLAILIWFVASYLLFGVNHSTYLILSILLIILGSLGLSVATIAIMLRRIERKIVDILQNEHDISK